MRYAFMMSTTAQPKDRLFQMRVSEDFLKRIDEWRRQQPDIPARAEAIRRLVEAALKADASQDEANSS